MESIAADSTASSVDHSPRARSAPVANDAKPGEPADVAAERLRARCLMGSLSPAAAAVPAILVHELRKV